MRFLATAIISALTTSGALAQSPGAIDTVFLNRAIRAQVDSGFTGVVLVADGDSVILRRAFNSRATHLGETSAFWIASITKSFTAAAVVRLQTQGRLTVRDSLSRFFPSAPVDKRAITLHQLLTHTAGLGGTGTGGGVVERTGAVRRILAQQLIYPPGDGYRYGDDDYELLAAVIEVVTGRPWQEVVQHELLDPARLRHTGFWCGPWRNLPRPVASVDGVRSTCGKGAAADWGHRGANGMAATADDLLAWTRVLRSETRGGTREFAAIDTPQVLVRHEGRFDISYGYGARIYTSRGKVAEVMYSGSGDDGHTSIIRQLASGITIIVLSSAGEHHGTTWSAYVAAQLGSRE
ncbi:MAG TPA: serine hydrolase domain-containing protein [Gemmatimonadaceae bacterium]|jgi:CubicO group peptidase (beta-lactamase class C family)|nr:serine hydrolase domain-containing protein [Gemmatimonadaceae bacterium]